MKIINLPEYNVLGPFGYLLLSVLKCAILRQHEYELKCAFNIRKMFCSEFEPIFNTLAHSDVLNIFLISPKV